MAADAIEEAQKRISELLQHPDDLSQKVSQLKAKFTAERASLDAILKTSVQTQLDDIQEGLHFLGNASEVIATVRSSLETIDKICLDSKSIIHNYTKIKKISRTHQNFIQTKEFLRQFQALSDDVEQTHEMLRTDSKDLLGNASNLLRIHYELFRLEEFRDQTIHKAKIQGPAVVQVLEKYFKRLDSLAESFREYLWSLARRFLDLIKNNQGSVVVRVVKIVEIEEKADERVLLTEQIRSSNPDLAGSNEWKTLTEYPRTVKQYQSQLFNAIHEQIAELFADGHFIRTNEDVPETLKRLSFVFEDLTLVHEELVPRVPERFKIFNFYVLQYHRQIYDALNHLVSRKLETRDILAVTSWVRDYYFIFTERFGVSEDLLEPRLLDDNEAILTQEYVKLIREKMMEWVDRLLFTEAKEFHERQQPPETDDEERYCTSAAVIFFKMMNQQIDIAIDSGKGGKLLFDVVNECFQIMSYFQQQQLKMLESEETAFFQPSNKDLAPGFPEYVVAFSNNHFRCSEFLEQFQKRLEEYLDDKHKASFSKSLNDTLEGFLKLSKRGYAVLINVVFHDISPVFGQIFTPAWYEQGQQIQLIITTMEDYFQDFRKRLVDYLFTKFTSDCLDKFLSLYLDSYRAKATKFRIPMVIDSIKSDIATSIQFWNEYKSPKRVKQNFDIFEKLVGLLESSHSMIFLAWYSLWKSYNDVPLSFIEELLHKRDDLDKSAVKEAINACKAKAKDGNPEATTSIFSKSTAESNSSK